MEGEVGETKIINERKEILFFLWKDDIFLVSCEKWTVSIGFLRYGTLCDICYAEFWNWKHLSDEWKGKGLNRQLLTLLAVIVDDPIL